MALLTLGYDVNSTDEKQLEEAKQKLIELMPNIRVFNSDSPKTPLLAGDVDLGMFGTAKRFNAQENLHLDMCSQKKVRSFSLMAWASQPTRRTPTRFASFNYLQGDVFWLTLVEYPYTNPNRSALLYKTMHPEVYDAYMASPIAFPINILSTVIKWRILAMRFRYTIDYGQR
jgi:hypothetical protein